MADVDDHLRAGTLQSELTPEGCRERLAARLASPLSFGSFEQPIWGWVWSTGFRIRHHQRMGVGPDAAGRFAISDGGTRISVELGPVAGMQVYLARVGEIGCGMA